ncbi:MAG: hypothetical protein JXA46_15150 [Dehalococcoidales bacterium]|nr:hypothetical protein [Dehalococcoidales bacterium]
MSAGRIVLLVFGILFVLVAFGLLMGGGIIKAVDSAFKDSDGYFTTGFNSIEAGSSMIVSEKAEIRMDTGWKGYSESPFKIKIEARNDDQDKPVFIGIARESDMKKLLKGRAYDEITDFDFVSGEINLWHHNGSGETPVPGDLDIWVASESGTGTRTLTWDVASGDYNVVIMNADGSTPVEVQVAFGVRVAGFIDAVGTGLIVGGIIALVIGGVMIFFAARGW